MKTINKQLNLISLIFSVTILFQSCTVYRSDQISLGQAVAKESKVRIESKNNNIDKFHRIILEDGHYYGIKRINGKILKFALNEDYTHTVKEKDKTTSTILTIALPVVAIATLVLISQDAFKWW
ncbi:hypothetical protein GSB9_02834 [Flavobacteriaceae bacterium GSB9]|nr:hypothetical protein GSB9_02834 [Flavobacteriaceae bacterium GSB9]